MKNKQLANFFNKKPFIIMFFKLHSLTE